MAQVVILALPYPNLFPSFSPPPLSPIFSSSLPQIFFFSLPRELFLPLSRPKMSLVGGVLVSRRTRRANQADNMIVHGSTPNPKAFMQIELQKIQMDPELKEQCSKDAEEFLRRSAQLIRAKMKDLTEDQEPGYYDGMTEEEAWAKRKTFIAARNYVRVGEAMTSWLAALQATNALSEATSVGASMTEGEIKEFVHLVGSMKDLLRKSQGKDSAKAEAIAQRVLAMSAPKEARLKHGVSVSRVAKLDLDMLEDIAFVGTGDGDGGES